MQRRILNKDDMATWHDSQAYDDLVCFIIGVSSKLKDIRMTDLPVTNECHKRLLSSLDKMDSWINENPVRNLDECRFGNVAFRDWHSKLVKNSKEVVEEIFKGTSTINVTKEDLATAIYEASQYLNLSFGSEVRLDYGTGHELNFVLFLMIFFKTGALDLRSDAVVTILVVFQRYLRLVRRIQSEYRLEPAGSHGAWSLDDYQFLCFLFGSAQFNDCGAKPNDFIDPTIYTRDANDFMFMSAIKHINEVKSGPFFEHSNQLWQISGVPTWRKVHQGLVKMYRVEVLGKFPVVQHLLFGKYFQFRQCERINK
ncbi:hypothetical protein ACOME3_003132 [Neoechinorhynchus agilis]